MPSLRDYLDDLSDAEILRIEDPVRRDFVPTALVMELQRHHQYPVVWLEQPGDHDIPVVANLFAARSRLSRACGGGDDVRASWRRAFGAPIKPRLVGDGPVHERCLVGDDVDVTQLPIARHFQDDAGRYVSSGILVSKDPRTGIANLSFQRMQLKGPNRFGVSLHSRGHIWESLAVARERGEHLEVAVVIGAHPSIYLAATAKVGIETDEMDLAGGLFGEPIDLVKGVTVDLEVPAEAEIVLEGVIRTDLEEDEGPFGEYPGYSTDRSTRNIFDVRAVTRRERPIYLDLIPGNSREHLLLARSAREAHVLERMREILPSVRDLRYPDSGTNFHVYLSMETMAEGQARHALMLVFGLDHYVKCAIALDSDIDIDSDEQVMWALATRVQADEDVFVVPRVFCNRLDPSSHDGLGAKMGIDATRSREASAARRIRLPSDAVQEAAPYLARVLSAGYEAQRS